MTLFSICSFSQEVKVNSIQKDSIMSINSELNEMEANTLMKKGTIIPDFSLTTLDGKTIQISEFRGKTVFINFFTLSCPNCMKELPLIENEIWFKYKNNKNVVILIVGREETIEKLREFREKKQFTFPMASDTERKAYSLFASKYVPRNIVIDKEGKLVFSEVGFTEEKSKELFQNIEYELNK
jgi:peroxiredoxin